MHQDESSKIRELEERIAYLETFVMKSLLFRLEDLSTVVQQTMRHDDSNQEVIDHIRHLADKARVGGWQDAGP